ncbi:MAG: 23S rRNA (adenine(2030)-N(6))-methyltransferase RlmJ [Nitrospirae bacterium]|nr:23S rRNA (adenine(2030)-N(6))-methyltransferase RlmJ [Magnetococcales bacterium]HAT50603.1 23S rRNA (adenine(2030)-N(6))-methyltransferase RlmJ [Alphaproteobacteria bacterium]
MLSYQHDYHAGGLADVHKHGCLAVILAQMVAKGKPLTYIESHAGAGLYDLASPMALKTGEAQQGIQRLLLRGFPPPGHPYRDAVETIRERFGPNHYPGSPWIARVLLPPEDPMHLMELHPGTQTILKKNFRGENHTHIHHRDGYEGVLAILPSNPRRCLIVCDPSYEVKTEYEQVRDFVLRIHRKCPEAVIMVWYPLLRDNLHPPMCRALELANLPKFSRREVLVTPPESPRRLVGSGVMVVNLPFGVEKSLDAIESVDIK